MSPAPVGEASVYELVQNAVCEPGSVLPTGDIC